MTYRKQDEVVTLEMSVAEYESMLLSIGFMAGLAARCGDVEALRSALRLANEMNRTNPAYTPYDVGAASVFTR